MNYKNLIVEEKNNIRIIRISRPEKLNALNHETLYELNDLFELLAADNSVKAVIITGLGEKAFVAGADIEEINNLNAESAKAFSKYGQSVFDKIENLKKPVIAAVNGYALGGGCELAMACHIRYASENAKFGQPEIKLGIIPGYGGTQRLSRFIGVARAIELMLTGEMINAQDALGFGLINKIFPQSELMNKCIELAEKISGMSSIIVSNALSAAINGAKVSLAEGLSIESEMFAKCCDSYDFKEGTSAFLQKRPAHFENK